MVFKIVIIVLALLGLVFVVGPFFNYAVFNSQCETDGCSGQICSAKKLISRNIYTPCEYIAEFGCNKDCKARNFQCSFDEEFRSSCLKCVQDCKVKYSLNKAVAQAMEACLSSCNNESLSTNPE